MIRRLRYLIIALGLVFGSTGLVSARLLMTSYTHSAREGGRVIVA